MSLVEDYHRWLLLSVDHVVPRGQAALLGIPPALVEDIFNLVVCCAGCNGFGNRYTVTAAGPIGPSDWTLERFLALRDAVFEDRRARIAERRQREVAFFEGRPWAVGAR